MCRNMDQDEDIQKLKTVDGRREGQAVNYEKSYFAVSFLHFLIV